MAKVDYQDLLTNVHQPRITDNIVLPKMVQLYTMFSQNNELKQGGSISDPNAISETTAGGAFTRADADPESMSVTWAIPTWTKVYYHEAALIRAEDIKEANGNLVNINNLFADAAARATKQLMNTHVFSGVMAQIKLDVDSASTYSDAAITRVTALQSYEEATDATITLAYLRAAYAALRLKDELDWSEYITIVEPTVWNTLWPLIDALTTKNVEAKIGANQQAGYLEVPVFDQVPIKSQYGMTTGDVFTLNRNDVQIQNHMPLELTVKEPKNLNEFAYKVIARIGVNSWVRRPAVQAKLTSKD